MATSSPVSNTVDLEHLDKYIFTIIDTVDDNTLLTTLLEDICYTLCYDPRDRVYGILCMLSANINLGIIPDYSKTKEEAYEDFVRRHIESSQRLDILALCELQNSSSDLLTWVPDLSVPKLALNLCVGEACGRSRHEGSFFNTNKGLHLCGVYPGTIKYVGNSVPHTAILSEILALCRS